MHARRWLPLATTLTVVAAVMWWSSSPETETALETPGSRAAQAPVEPPTLTEASPASDGERSDASARDAPPHGGEPPEPAAVETLSVRGAWTAVDGQGLQHRAEHGRFVARPYGAHDPIAIDVRAGLWSASLPRGPFEVEDLLLGGRRAVPVGPGNAIVLEEGLELDLVARWVRDAVLVVVDQATQVELAGVELVGPHPAGGPWAHPGPYRAEHVIQSGARSPLTIPAPEHIGTGGEEERYWVRAPGHAFVTLVVPRAVGGELLVALGPAGELAVTALGLDAGLEAWLRLRDPSAPDPEDHHAVRFEARIEPDVPLVLESLAARTYLASVELGHRYAEPRVLAFEEIVVERDARVDLVLTAEPLARASVASLAGQLVVPPAWELERGFGLYLTRVDAPRGADEGRRYLRADQMRLEDSERGAWAWRADELELGTWELRMNPIGTSLSVLLPPGGREGVVLEVPPPAVARVHVRDSGTGEPVADADLFWQPSREGLETGGVWNGAGTVAPGSFWLRAPAGDVDLSVSSETHRGVRERVTLGAGESELTLETSRACGLLLSLRDGTTSIDVRGLEVTLTPIAGAGEARRRGEDAHGIVAKFVTTQPGRWRVELPALAGYRAAPPFEVDVPEGAFVEHVVELERGR